MEAWAETRNVEELWVDNEPRSVVTSVRARKPLPQMQNTVAQIWAEALGIEAIEPGASFFELGGHSLLAIRVMARIQDRIGPDMPLTDLFTHPTLDAFSTAVAAELDGKAPAEDDLAILLDDMEQFSDEDAAAMLAALEAEFRSET